MKYFNEDESGIYAMGKEAHHKTGDISRDEWDLIIIFGEDEENYIGNWVYGFGLIHVKFPKNSIRQLNKKEIKKYEGRGYAISGQFMGKTYVEDYLWKKP